MTNTSNAQTIHTTLDKVRMVASVALVVAAVVLFYYLSKQDLWLRVVILIAGLLVAAILYGFTEGGKQLIAYGKDSVGEVNKVVWPSRQEALQMTGYVFAFVVVMALLLWLTDKTLEWLLYSVILGWTR
jgi:preprotein translocase subunit SecE